MEAEPMTTTRGGPSLPGNGFRSSNRDPVDAAALIQQVIEDGNYTPDQVFSASKTGLFWKRLPGQTFISKNGGSSKSCNDRDDRFTLLLCANASRDFRLKPLLIYRILKPKDLAVTSFQMLPVHWRFNKRAFLTPMLFEDWFATCAIPEISAYCKQKNLEDKALVLVDGVFGYPEVVNEIHPTIKVMFLPGDKSPSVQPLDHCAIAQFQQLYTKSLLQKVLFFAGEEDIPVENFCLSYSIKEALFVIRDSWIAIKTPFLNKIWRYVWPDIAQNCIGLPNNTREIQEIRELAGKIPGQDFLNITDDNIRSHLESHWEELTKDTQEEEEEEDGDEQQETPVPSMPSTSELKSIIKLLYETERTLIEKEWNPSRLEHSLPHLRSIKAIYLDALKKREDVENHYYC